MLGTELSLMEMTEVEYTHLQHLIQAQVEAQAGSPDGPDARGHPATLTVKDATGSTVISPFTTTQAIDLSTSTDEHCLVMPGEKTPASYAEVPGFVMARIRGENSPSEPPASSRTSSLKRSRSAARVCLEKRFNTVSADTPRNDIQSAVLTNFLTILQQSAEAHEAVIHPQMQKWMKTDRPNPFEVTNVGGVFNPVTNMCDDEVTPTASRKSGSACGSRPIKAANAASESAGESGSSTRKRAQFCMSHSQRRERHNSKERERRRRIRLCCDELNMLVPFCDSDTDKVTTLQWTTAFLSYINKTYGDTFKEEFQTAFTEEKGLFLKSNPSPGQDTIHREMDETLSIPLAVEQ
ncbi:transcription factor-like 5 protein [Seriola lalandi dorsalis]|uniref:transcription factor-like 5 protein n=1 Tax=Seriola lalandi dorsalis TaxID=1841481 RepID=UPI000C6F7BE8|nr:transcription factor-like 5 protein [Seriola lalandi dorsalis]